MEFNEVYSSDTESRIDVYLSEKLKDISRNKIQTFIKSGFLKINGCLINKPNYKLIFNDKINLSVPESKNDKILKESIPIDIVYEDDYIIALNKEIEVITHPAGTIKTGTLVNALKYLNKIPDKEYKITDYEYRPGVIHRLDKDTSGLIIFGKTDIAVKKMAELFKKRQIEKKYIALVYGNIKEDKGIISYPIGRHQVNRKIMTVREDGKPSETEFIVVERSNNYSLLKILLKTGRTHQIRVHLKAIGNPVVGDSIYSTKSSKKENRLMLHSYSLKFKHPFLKKEIFIKADLKKEFEDFIRENHFEFVKK